MGISSSIIIWELAFHSGGQWSFPLGHFPFFDCVPLGPVQRQNDEPPKMVLEPVRVHEGSGVVVTNASLNLQDLDTQNSELVIMVTKSPEHGKS